MKIFGQVLLNKNLAVKLEVMNIIARGRTGEARRLIAEALNDAVAQVRMLAARLLPEFDREKAYVDLVRLVKDPSFEKKSRRSNGHSTRPSAPPACRVPSR